MATATRDWLTVQEVAQLAKVHKETVLRWIRSGALRAYRLGTSGGYRIERKDFDSYLVSTKRGNGK